MKKTVLTLLILAVLISSGLYAFSRKAPELLRKAIENAIDKDVRIEAIEYRFPWTFELKGFQILETSEPFKGEICFSVDKVLLDVSPVSLSSRKRLIVDSIDVRGARVVIRKRGNKLMHALSGAKTSAASGTPGEPPGASQSSSTLPLTIRRFHLGESRFQFMDYDVQEAGFVIELDQIEADIQDVSVPPVAEKTNYRIDARLPQGRQQRAGDLHAAGWTVFSNDETDAQLRVSDLSLPYFRPYYGQVTPAEIEEGRLSSRTALRIHDRAITADVDLELVGLYFKGYEEGDQLFGLKAEEILPFLKDSAGRLQFHVVLEWDLNDRTTDKRAIIRRAIEKSLKKTLLGNIGGILEKTLQKFADPETVLSKTSSKGDLKEALKKVKKLFR